MSTKTDREGVAAADLMRDKYVTEGATLYTVLRSVARSGMSRTMDVYIIRDNEPVYLTGHVAQVLDYRRDAQGALKVSGAGMDMGFHVVYSLAQALYGNGYALTQRWL